MLPSTPPIRADLRHRLDLPARLPLDFATAQQVAHRLRQDGLDVRTGDLLALALLHRIFAHLIRRYQTEVEPATLPRLVAWLCAHPGAGPLDRALYALGEAFPDAQEPPARLGDLIHLELAHLNPALGALRALVDDNALRTAPDRAYAQIAAALWPAAASLPPFGRPPLPLLDFLALPIRTHPHDLAAQLRFALTHWADLLPPDLLDALRHGLDVLAEERRPRPAGPPPPPAPPTYAGLDALPARYSADRDWMPRLVLTARHTFVWLHQLSQRYGRPIHRLDQIPEEELARLAARGINGLWLIGLWQRSPASQRIKQLTGQPDAAASAYAVYAYRIADELGGEAALDVLRQRAAAHGIRLGADVVPNHTGLDAPWVIEHPDWFLQTDHPPFPAYTFHGPDLSSDPRVAIRIEDHYYDRSDAAVVFQWQDRRTGQTRYIYHGNDGTSIPWNDTAQLNHLRADVREALIQTLLAVARRFPIIRLDAAMTLTRQHYRRLWFPEPGTGGAIPSRAAFAMPREAFDRAMPREFWLEVVERMAAEAPDTLLLAEAFWMLEGYFVRTLGMHRVYNAAFMHMLRDQDNAAFRRLIRETLEFDPQILKRYVNFMSNPDEAPAGVQFGDGDRYFGVCTLMVTLPGLPMFAHGQWEGLREQYGHEFRRPLLDEPPNAALVARHDREIAPLLHRRALFADVAHFALYDFRTPAGHVDENVIAFSNRRGEERAVVLFHNRWAETEGRLHRAHDGRTLAQWLDIPDRPGLFVRYRDHVTGLQHLIAAADLHRHGLYFRLGAFHYHVLLDFHLVQDTDGRYARLAATLGRRGVPDLDAALDDLDRSPFEAALDDLRTQLQPLTTDPHAPIPEDALLTALQRALQAQGAPRPDHLIMTTRSRLAAIRDLTRLESVVPYRRSPRFNALAAELHALPAADRLTLLLWALTAPLSAADPLAPPDETARQRLAVPLLSRAGLTTAETYRRLQALPWLHHLPDRLQQVTDLNTLAAALWQTPGVGAALHLQHSGRGLEAHPAARATALPLARLVWVTETLRTTADLPLPDRVRRLRVCAVELDELDHRLLRYIGLRPLSNP